MSTGDLQRQLNIIRKMRTEEYAKNCNKDAKDAFKDPSFSCRSDITTTSLCCSCDDCVKYYGHGKPVKCIDPYLMDMRYTNEIYHGLVTASKTTTTRTPGDCASKKASPGTGDEETKITQRKN